MDKLFNRSIFTHYQYQSVPIIQTRNYYESLTILCITIIVLILFSATALAGLSNSLVRLL